eukprot:SAG31_NODE_83_length_27039_cov_14.035746_11_plen_43_part_00
MIKPINVIIIIINVIIIIMVIMVVKLNDQRATAACDGAARVD